MYVGVDLDATARAKGPRLKTVRTPRFDTILPSQASSASAAALRRSRSLPPPSERLTSNTKSFGARSDEVMGGRSEPKSGSKSARAAPSGSSRLASTGTPRSPGGGASAGASPSGAASARLAGSSNFYTSPGGTARYGPGSARYGPGSSRTRHSSYSARVLMHSQTHSPSGRFHPDPVARRELRKADMLANIDYYSPHGAPDNDRKMKEASWLCSQSFIESLRVYPDPTDVTTVLMPGEEVAFSGNTQSARRKHTEHVETALRRRMSIAPADKDWLPEQLPVQWPYLVPDGHWRDVASTVALRAAGSTSAGGAGLFGRLFKGGKVGSPSSRAAAAAIAAHNSSQAGSEEALSSRGQPSSRGSAPLPSSRGASSRGQLSSRGPPSSMGSAPLPSSRPSSREGALANRGVPSTFAPPLPDPLPEDSMPLTPSEAYLEAVTPSTAPPPSSAEPPLTPNANLFDR